MTEQKKGSRTQQLRAYADAMAEHLVQMSAPTGGFRGVLRGIRLRNEAEELVRHYREKFPVTEQEGEQR